MSRPVTAPVIVCLLLSAATDTPAAGPPAPDLDPNRPYRAGRFNPRTYRVDFRAAVTAPAGTRTLRVWLPLPPSDFAQQVSGRTLETFPDPVEPAIGREKVYGNEFACFEFKEPKGAQVIRHQFTIKTWELNWRIDPGKVVAVHDWPAGFRPYLEGDRAVRAGGRFAEAARGIVKERTNPAADLITVMDWLQANMKYDHAKASLSADSERALETLTGHCSDYHGLCAAFGRSLGFPTRVTYGINPVPKASPSHCKLDAYLPPYGWVTFDVSETQKLLKSIAGAAELTEARRQELAAAALKRLRGGYRDNTWFLQTRGTDYELAPPASRRVNLVRTLYAEADGVPLRDPDPSDPDQREFAWMTAHRYTPDRPVAYPFQDWRTFAHSLGGR